MLAAALALASCQTTQRGAAPTASTTDAQPTGSTTDSLGPAAETDLPEVEGPTEVSQEAFEDAATRARDGDLASAIALLEDGLKRFPDNQKVRRAMVLAYSRQGEQLAATGDTTQAAAVLGKAAALDPDNPAIAGRLQNLRDRIEADGIFEKGLTLADKGDTDAALAAFEEALNKAPDHTEARAARDELQTGLVDGIQREAIAALREADYQTALDLWAQILEIDPSNGTADRYHKHTQELMSRQAELTSE